MARKNIYVADADQPVFDRAQELAGEEPMSGIIVEALRRYVAQEEAKAQGWQEISIEVGISDQYRTQRFIGRELASQTLLTGQTSDRRDRGIDFEAYATQKGQILIHATRWSRWEGERSTKAKRVFASLEALREDPMVWPDDEWNIDIPGSLIDEIEAEMGEAVGEYLDI